MMQKLTAFFNNQEGAELKSSLSGFLSSFVSREERHYCACLFAWLIKDYTSVQTFFSLLKENSPENLIPDFEATDFKNCKIYYEFTFLRELFFTITGKYDTDVINDFLTAIKSDVFKGSKGDIKKKKPDLAFYFPQKGFILLIEAKFEEGFTDNQIKSTTLYGKSIEHIFSEGNGIKTETALLGRRYFINKKKDKYPSLTWEQLAENINDGNIKNYILEGLRYQEKIHPKTKK